MISLRCVLDRLSREVEQTGTCQTGVWKEDQDGPISLGVAHKWYCKAKRLGEFKLA